MEWCIYFTVCIPFQWFNREASIAAVGVVYVKNEYSSKQNRYNMVIMDMEKYVNFVEKGKSLSYTHTEYDIIQVVVKLTRDGMISEET